MDPLAMFKSILLRVVLCLTCCSCELLEGTRSISTQLQVATMQNEKEQEYERGKRKQGMPRFIGKNKCLHHRKNLSRRPWEHRSRYASNIQHVRLFWLYTSHNIWSNRKATVCAVALCLSLTIRRKSLRDYFCASLWCGIYNVQEGYIICTPTAQFRERLRESQSNAA